MALLRPQNPLLLCEFEDSPLLDPIISADFFLSFCIYPGNYTLNMYDSDGDGWFGAPLSKHFPDDQGQVSRAGGVLGALYGLVERCLADDAGDAHLSNNRALLILREP